MGREDDSRVFIFVRSKVQAARRLATLELGTKLLDRPAVQDLEQRLGVLLGRNHVTGLRHDNQPVPSAYIRRRQAGASEKRDDKRHHVLGDYRASLPPFRVEVTTERQTSASLIVRQ